MSKVALIRLEILTHQGSVYRGEFDLIPKGLLDMAGKIEITWKLVKHGPLVAKKNCSRTERALACKSRYDLDREELMDVIRAWIINNDISVKFRGVINQIIINKVPEV
jgi:hypothetical protein